MSGSAGGGAGRGRRGVTRLALGLVLPLVLAALWEAAYRTALVEPVLISSPLQVLAHLPALLGGHIPQFQGAVLRHLLVSLGEAGAGFAWGVAAGVLLGTLMGLSRTASRLLWVPVEMYRPMPPMALLPLMLFWFGVGFTSKLVLIGLNCLIPTLLATSGAILGVDRALLNAARSYGPTAWQTFRKVILPAALPGVLTGMRLSIASAFTILVAAEMIGSDAGIGWMLLRAWRYLEVEVLYAGILGLSLIALGLDSLLRLAGRRCLRWQRGATLRGGE